MCFYWSQPTLERELENFSEVTGGWEERERWLRGREEGGRERETEREKREKEKDRDYSPNSFPRWEEFHRGAGRERISGPHPEIPSLNQGGGSDRAVNGGGSTGSGALSPVVTATL